MLYYTIITIAILNHITPYYRAIPYYTIICNLSNPHPFKRPLNVPISRVGILVVQLELAKLDRKDHAMGPIRTAGNTEILRATCFIHPSVSRALSLCYYCYYYYYYYYHYYYYYYYCYCYCYYYYYYYYYYLLLLIIILLPIIITILTMIILLTTSLWPVSGTGSARRHSPGLPGAAQAPPPDER